MLEARAASARSSSAATARGSWRSPSAARAAAQRRRPARSGSSASSAPTTTSGSRWTARSRARTRATAITLGFHTWRFWQKRGYLYEARRRLGGHGPGASWSRRDPLTPGAAAWRHSAAWLVAGRHPGDGAGVPARRSTSGAPSTIPAELANAIYNYSFAFTVPDAVPPEFVVDGDALPDGEQRPAARGARAVPAHRRRARRGERPVGHRQHAATSGTRSIPASEDLRARPREVPQGRRPDDGGVDPAHARRRPHPDQPTGRGRARTCASALRLFYDGRATRPGSRWSSTTCRRWPWRDEDLERAARLWGAARALPRPRAPQLAVHGRAGVEGDVRPNVRTALGPRRLDALAREGGPRWRSTTLWPTRWRRRLMHCERS